ncbi:hypothetical protein FIBSPDRAFT_903812 [Athelia psychrophila]|uniref:Uncharacterized protein n=1 Tax=Athelia psychrophila TaxID=1759441 RepID=A0A167VHZ0_9AGAM|nr:hypothetical protein FIBSPDRAFT_903812 [Fibularhizoctonia sp. CBS 109695]
MGCRKGQQVKGPGSTKDVQAPKTTNRLQKTGTGSKRQAQAAKAGLGLGGRLDKDGAGLKFKVLHGRIGIHNASTAQKGSTKWIYQGNLPCGPTKQIYQGNLPEEPTRGHLPHNDPCVMLATDAFPPSRNL